MTNTVVRTDVIVRTDEIVKNDIDQSKNTKAEVREAVVISNEEIADEIWRLCIRCGSMAEDAKPGQFVNVYLRDKSLLLPRPISICLAEPNRKVPEDGRLTKVPEDGRLTKVSEDGRLTLVYRVVGKGTKVLSEYSAGDSIRISTPLGHGYDLDAVFDVLKGKDSMLETRKGNGSSEASTVALVAGGLGVPPMLELAKALRARLEDDRFSSVDSGSSASVRLIAALGFQDEVFLTEELKRYCDELYIATDSGKFGWHGNVLAMMEAREIQGDYYLSCGPKPMLKALAESCGKEGKPLQVSLEERMGCGYGACVGCTCKVREIKDGAEAIKQKKVCKDGPVFFGDEVIWDE